MDYLPIQASAVPCERVFSSSSETDTKKRNRIKPELMEALQILKFALKKERMNFTKDLLVDEKDLLILKDETNSDPLANMLNLNTNSFNAFLQSVLED
jgi:hAT family C-terminal dimerisation region